MISTSRFVQRLTKGYNVERFRLVSPLLAELIRPRIGRLLLGLMIVMIGRAAALALPASTKYLVDDVISRRNGRMLIPLTLFLIASSQVQALCTLGLTRLVSEDGLVLIVQLRRKLQAHLGRLPTSFHDVNRTGELAQRIMGDAEAVRNLFGPNLVEFVGGLLTALYSIVFLWRIDARLTGVAMICIATFSVISRQRFQRMRRMFIHTATIQAEVLGRLIESLGGIRVVKGYAAEAHEERVLAAGFETLRTSGVRTVRAGTALALFTATSTGLLTAATIYLATREIFAGALTLGGLMAFTAFLSVLTAPMMQVPGLGTILADALARLGRVQQLLSETREDDNPRRVERVESIQGCVSFENVSFTYNSDKVALQDINFRSEPSTVTALVGSSGSGKSTLVGLVAGFYDPTKGIIRIDNHDLTTVVLDSYRRQLGVVLQETFLFDGTIRENVAFARPNALESEILEACRIARVDAFTEQLPRKYDTLVGERGVRLSGGQRQRISIARAILANPRILILDEATSSLDSESEFAIQEGLAYLMKGRTTFVIAHRLSTIRQADQILVLENGRIQERGSHDSLYAARGRYYDLYTRQYFFSVPQQDANHRVKAMESPA